MYAIRSYYVLFFLFFLSKKGGIIIKNKLLVIIPILIVVLIAIIVYKSVISIPASRLFTDELKSSIVKISVYPSGLEFTTENPDEIQEILNLFSDLKLQICRDPGTDGGYMCVIYTINDSITFTYSRSYLSFGGHWYKTDHSVSQEIREISYNFV